jgi:hypothetical protein
VNQVSDDQANAVVASEEGHPFPQGVPTSVQEPVIQFNTTAYSVHPGDKFAKVIVSLAGKYSGVVTVDFSTADKTARAGSDYLPVSWRLVFANNKTTIVVPIPILTGAQPNETVALKLQDPTGAILGAKQAATLKIN